MSYYALANEAKAMLIARLARNRALAKKARQQGRTTRLDLERVALEEDWRPWLLSLVPQYFQRKDGSPVAFAPHHEEFWHWVWAVQPGVRPQPYIQILARGGGKSTGCELATIALGARRVRRYCLYISGTQDQADKHVDSIAGILEGDALGRLYPDLVHRAIGKYGTSKGWRRNRLRCRSGFTVDALGLDVMARGVKIEEIRPDLIIFDDLDDAEDGSATIATKLRRLSQVFLPAGSRDAAVLGVQNLQHVDSIFSRFVDGRADFLNDRRVSGPYPALEGFAYELTPEGQYRIIEGTPTWAGQDVEACQDLLNTIGLTAFRRECQHEVQDEAGGLFGHLEFRHCTHAEVPELLRIVLAVDPAVTDTDSSDSHGIQADGLGVDGTIYRLFSWEARSSPEAVLKRAIAKAIELKASTVIVETDQGGDLWRSTFYRLMREVEEEHRAAWDLMNALLLDDPDEKNRPIYPGLGVSLTFDAATAGAIGSKAHRASLMLVDYEHGAIVHVLGTHDILERALRRFLRRKPFDLVDSAFWSWHKLRLAPRPRARNPAA
jgi:hypothetical protein